MTYPTQQPGPYPPQPAAPGYPQPQAPYAPAQPGYPPQQQPAPGYPQQQGYAPPQGYGQPQGYPQQQGYGQQGPPAEAAPVVGLADYANAPVNAFGPSLGSFFKGTPGQKVTVRTARALTDADVRPQTVPGTNGTVIAKFPDNHVKTVLVVPVYVLDAVASFPEGRASWWVQGSIRDELNRAMLEAGVPQGQLKYGPEAGAQITILLADKRPPRQPGMSPANVWQITYYRPAGAANGNGDSAPAQAPPQQAAPPRQQPQIPQEIRDMVPQGPGAPANFANPGGHYDVPQYPGGPPQQAQAQWPQPGAPVSAPPQPAPPGENPYNNPALPGYQGQPQQWQPAPPPVPTQFDGTPLPGQPPQYQPPQPQYQPPFDGQPQPQAVQQPGPGAQVAAATQAGVAAAQQAQPQPGFPPEGMDPVRAAKLRALLGVPGQPQQ